MNMISTGAFQTEMGASDKQSSLVNKLVTAWEKKNSKTARAGGVSLMALSLAACGSSDDTSDAVTYTQAQLDTAALAATTAAQSAAATAAAAAATAAASDKASAVASATTVAEAAAATAAAAAATAAASDKAAAVAGAKTASDGTTYATIDAAITSNDAAIALAATAAAEIAAAATAAKVKSAADQALATLQTAYDNLTKAKDSNFTAVDGESPGTTSNNDTFSAVVSATNALNTFQSNDTLADLSSADADTLTVTADGDITVTPTISGIETININVNALSSGADVTDFDVALTNFSAGAVINIDSVDASSIISTVTFTNDKGHTINTSADFTGLTSALSADGDGIYNMSAIGDSVNPTTITVTGAADTVTIDSKGFIGVTAAAVTDLVNVTAVNNVTITDATASAGLFVTAGGNVTITDANSATVVNITASGSVTGATGALDAALTPVVKAGTTLDIDVEAATAVTVEGAKTIEVTEDGGGTTLVLVNATVKTEATTIDLDDAAGVVTVNVSGDQNYTLQMDAALIDAAGDIVTLTDTTTAGTSLFKIGDAAGNVDAKSMTIDEIDLAIANSAKTLTVKSGQLVNISTDQTATSAIAGVAATSSTNSVTVNFDDGVDSATTTAVDVSGDLDFTNFATINLNMSEDSLSNGNAETHIIDDMDGSGDINVTMGANKLSITGDLALGATNKMTITGSGTVTGDGNESITVKEIDASGVSGVVTLATLNATEVGTVTTGAGADVLTHTAGAADFTVTTGAGNDQLTLAAVGVGTNSLVLDMGTGTDTLVFADTQTLTTNATNTHSVSGVDKLSYAGAFTIDSTVINNATWEISESTAATDNLTVTVLAADTAIDVSGLTVTSANAAAVALDTFVINASGAGVDGVSSIKGSLINKNTITANDLDATTIVGGGFADALTGANKADNITGGAGIDTIDGDAGNDTLTGGAGADVFLVGSGAAGSNDTITDFVVGAANDDIHISNAAMEIASGTTGQFSMLDDWADIATSATVAYQTITGAYDLTGATADTNVLVLNGADVANAAAAETALETGGAYALTIKGTLAALDIFGLMYDNGVDSYFAAVQSTAGVADNALPAAGDLTVTHLLTFSGITDCSTIVAAQYADII